MRPATGAVYGTVAIIVLLTVLSGPLVGAVDFSRDRSGPTVGVGNLSVDSVDAPDRATLDRAFQSKNYYLKVPDIRIHVASISGRPIAEYSLSVRGLNYSRSTTHFLDADRTGWVHLSMEEESFGPNGVNATRYEGRLSLVVRYNDTERTLYSAQVPVVVTE